MRHVKKDGLSEGYAPKKTELVGMEVIQDLIELAFWSAYIKGERVVSLMVVSEPEGGKTIINNGQWVCLPCNLKKLGKFDISTPFRIQKEVYTLSADVLRLMSDCNNICQSKSKDAVFKITNKVLEKIGDIEKAIKTKDEFGNFADALYEIIYEGSGSLNRVPESFKKDDFIGLSIKFVRNDLRHDLEHGEEKEIKQKKARVSKIYQKYTGRTSLSSLKSPDFQSIQLGFLKELKSFLENLKQHCIDS